MMRKPTPHSELYEWHSFALATARHPMTVIPCCGWFAVRLEEKGPFLPASIYLEQPVDDGGELTGPEVLRCEIGGQEAELTEERWFMLATRPISEAEYHALMAQLMGENYSGPQRPRCRWNNTAEVGGDMERYEVEP